MVWPGADDGDLTGGRAIVYPIASWDAQLAAAGKTDEDLCVAQLHYTVLRHFARACERPSRECTASSRVWEKVG